MGRKERDRPSFILSLDPSGSFHEGKGTTGVLGMLLDESGIVTMQASDICAKNFKTQTAYWNAHLELIGKVHTKYRNITLVVEDYLLYADKAAAQTSSRMETSQLLGAIKLYAATHNIKLVMQTAVMVKKRWSNEILEHNGYITKGAKGYYINTRGTYCKVHRHMLDALRHAIHYYTFNVKESQ